MNTGVNIYRSNVLLLSSSRIISIALILLTIFLTLKYDALNINIINSIDLDILKQDIRKVAKCEDKSIQKMYSELKNTYNIFSFKKISREKYHEILDDLKQRKCEIEKNNNL